jgi:HSP20 family protein
MRLELDRLMNDVFRMFPAYPATVRAATATAGFSPAVDVREEGDTLVLQADVPGLGPEHIKVQVEDGVLTITGERAEPRSDKAVAYHRAERGWGAFERRFQLPREIDAERIEATVEHGVLTVKLARRPETRPRQIEIKTR